MPADIKLPGLGEVPKKYVVGGVVAGGGIAIIVFVRSRKASQANTANQTAAQAGLVTDPAGNQCAAVDPNSGYCPGSPEDVSYQQSASGYYGTPGGVSGAGTTAPVPSDGGSQGTTPIAPTGPQTNAEWVTAALAVLPGGDTPENEAALAGVLGGLTVTTAQKDIFLEAVGLVGQPPQGYPAPIKTSDTAGHPGPKVTAAGAVSNLTVTAHGTTVIARWNPAVNATGGYRWELSGPVSKHGHTRSTSASVNGLKKGEYNFGIQALPGGPGNNEHVTVA